MGTWCPPRADAVWQGGGKCSGSEGDPASPWGQLGGNAPAVRGTFESCWAGSVSVGMLQQSRGLCVPPGLGEML